MTSSLLQNGQFIPLTKTDEEENTHGGSCSPFSGSSSVCFTPLPGILTMATTPVQLYGTALLAGDAVLHFIAIFLQGITALKKKFNCECVCVCLAEAAYMYDCVFQCMSV